MRPLDNDQVRGMTAAAEEQRYNDMIAEYDDWSDEELQAAVESDNLISDDDDVEAYSREALINLIESNKRY